jgi:hypothetical protein
MYQTSQTQRYLPARKALNYFGTITIKPEFTTIANALKCMADFQRSKGFHFVFLLGVWDGLRLRDTENLFGKYTTLRHCLDGQQPGNLSNRNGNVIRKALANMISQRLLVMLRE